MKNLFTFYCLFLVLPGYGQWHFGPEVISWKVKSAPPKEYGTGISQVNTGYNTGIGFKLGWNSYGPVSTVYTGLRYVPVQLTYRSDNTEKYVIPSQTPFAVEGYTRREEKLHMMQQPVVLTLGYPFWYAEGARLNFTLTSGININYLTSKSGKQYVESAQQDYLLAAYKPDYKRLSAGFIVMPSVSIKVLSLADSSVRLHAGYQWNTGKLRLQGWIFGLYLSQPPPDF